MKRFFKFCAITALSMAVIGGIMLGVSSMLVGPKTISDMVAKLTNGKVVMDFKQGFHVDFGDSSLGSFLKEHAIYNIEDAGSFDKNHDIWKGDVKKTLLTEEGVRNWKLGLGGCIFELKDSGDASYYVEYTGKGKSQAYVDGDTLHVMVLNGSEWSVGNSKECLTLYVPMGIMVEEIEAGLGAGQMVLDDLQVQKLVLDLGAGQVTAEKLQVEQLSASVGAGEIILKDVQLKDVEVEVGAGNCEIDGTIAGNVDAGCAMGNLTLELTGKETDFDYEIQCVSGNITVGDREYSGLAQEQNIDNGAEQSMDVECAMGNVEILFE